MEEVRPDEDVMNVLEEQVVAQTRIAALQQRYIEEEDEWLVDEAGDLGNQRFEAERATNSSIGRNVQNVAFNENNKNRERKINEDDFSWDHDENDRHVSSTRVSFPEEVQHFLLALFMEVYERNVENIRKLYENDFYQITEKYYENTRWPSLQEVQMFYEDMGRFHSLILTLYAELYYRHVFSTCQQSVTWVDRKNSWENYKSLLEHFIEEETRAKGDNYVKRLRLPMQWVWDMLDEFAYQFQETCRFRAKFIKTYYEGSSSCEYEEQRQALQCVILDTDVWKGSVVFELLLSLVEVSDVNSLLKRNKEELFHMNMETELKYQLGYFSMITLLRLYVLIGDYYSGLLMINNLDTFSRFMYLKVPACQVSFCYHMAFAYMMLRRYNDSTRVASQLLICVSKQKSYLSAQTHQHTAMSKIIDRIYHTVLLCQTLCSNIKLDETVGQTVKEKYSDRFFKLQQDNETTYQEVFFNACPKFINAATVESIKALDGGEYLTLFQEPSTRQFNIFMKEVICMKKVSNIRSFAKLYNNIQLQKLGSLMAIKEKDVDEAVRSDMMCVKHKSRQHVWKSGPLLNSDLIPYFQEVDFSVDNDMINIKSLKTKYPYVDYFLKQIAQYQSLLECIENTSYHRAGKQENQREKYHRGLDKGIKEQHNYNRAVQ